MSDADTSPSRITHGAVHVLAQLYETDAPCSEVARETCLAEATAYRWLTELAEVGILETDAMQIDGHAVVVYSLDDDELGAAAQVIVDRL